MELEERFRARLRRHGVKLLQGRASRCFMSISCYTPAYGDRPAVISIHPELGGARAVEALAFQLAWLDGGDVATRFRYTALTPPTRAIARTWRRAALLALPEREWEAALQARLTVGEIEERLDVTARLVQLRWAFWTARRTHTVPLAFPDMSLTFKPTPFWCEGG